MSIKTAAKRMRKDVAGLKPGKNWLTTLGGVLLAAGAAAPFLPPPYNAYAGAAGAAGGVLLGTAARQANVSSAEMEKESKP
jgi:hypothetical protein